MTRLAIGIVLGFMGLFGMGLGGGLDLTPVQVACKIDCTPSPARASLALAECPSCPHAPDEG